MADKYAEKLGLGVRRHSADGGNGSLLQPPYGGGMAVGTTDVSGGKVGTYVA